MKNMDINEMTTEQIEQYLQERRTRKGELGGQLMRADDVPVGKTVWLKCVKTNTMEVSSLFLYDVENTNDSISVYNKTLVETNVPERAPARRRMTAGEASDDNLLKQGDIIWIKAEVRYPGDGGAFQPCFSGLPKEFSPWLDLDQEIEVDA